jgi:hypothetical protein
VTGSPPLFSVLIPSGVGLEADVARTVDSVSAQSGALHELIVLHAPGGADTLPGSPNYSAHMNAAIESANGEFVMIVWPGDELDPNALEHLASSLASDPAADVVYADEVLVDEGGASLRQMRKPEPSIHRLRSQMYLGRMFSIRRALAVRLGLRDFPGAEHHDLVLRAVEESARFVCVGKPLYRRVLRDGDSPFLVRDDKAGASGVAVLAEHLARQDIDAEVSWWRERGTFRVRRRIRSSPLVSIVIPTRGGSARIRGVDTVLVTNAVAGVLATSSYQNIEFVIVADAETPPHVLRELQQLGGERLRVVPWTLPFNFSAKINLGAIEARGEYLLLLNDDVELMTPDWIEALLSIGQGQDVGLVGVMLYYEDGSIQHAGHRYTAEIAGHIGLSTRGDTVGLPGSMSVDREVSGATAACMLVARRAFFDVGGFTECLPASYDDVDFCLKMGGSGLTAIWTPHVELVHFESQSRDGRITEYEQRTLFSRWRSRLASDPFWPL